MCLQKSVIASDVIVYVTISRCRFMSSKTVTSPCLSWMKWIKQSWPQTRMKGAPMSSFGAALQVLILDTPCWISCKRNTNNSTAHPGSRQTPWTVHECPLLDKHFAITAKVFTAARLVKVVMFYLALKILKLGLLCVPLFKDHKLWGLFVRYLST